MKKEKRLKELMAAEKDSDSEEFDRAKPAAKPSTAKKPMDSDSDDFGDYSGISSSGAGDQALPSPPKKVVKPAENAKLSAAKDRLRKIEETEKKEKLDKKLEELAKDEMSDSYESDSPSAKARANAKTKKVSPEKSAAKKEQDEKKYGVSEESEPEVQFSEISGTFEESVGTGGD